MSEYNVMLMKLASGEELICKALDGAEGEIVVKNPLVVFLDRNEAGQMNVGFAQFMVLAADQQVTINPLNVVAMANPEQSTIDNYLRIIGDTVIDVPPEKKILMPN